MIATYNDLDSLSINSHIIRKFHGQCVEVIAGVFIRQCVVFVLRKHWRWLNTGGHINEGIIMAGNRVLIKGLAAVRGGRAGLDCI